MKDEFIDFRTEEEIEFEKAEKQKDEQLDHDYKKLFTTREGVAVLHDIMKHSYLMPLADIFDKDSVRMTDYRAGVQSIGRYILSRAKGDTVFEIEKVAQEVHHTNKKK